MHNTNLLAVLALITPFSALAAWVEDESSHCQIEVRSSVPGELFSWSGACVSGKADGQGVLTSSHGAFLNGQYKSGRPQNAYGRWGIPKLYAGGPLVPWYLTYQNGEAIVKPMPLPGVHQTLEVTSSAALVGKWNLSSYDGTCVEALEFKRGGTEIASSGKEILESAYGVLSVENHPKTFAVITTTIRSNGQTDCIGKVATIDRSVVNYVEFVHSNTIRFCSVEEPSKCGATAVRETPERSG